MRSAENFDMQHPLVSIIVPAYNPGRLILDTLTSIFNQSYKNIEIIVVDDGSTDGTKALLQPLVHEGKLTYVFQENQGQAVARRRGFEESHGAYVSFIDADDLIAPQKIELQVKHFTHNPVCDVCYSGIAHFWDHDRQTLLRKKLRYYSGQIFDKLIKENFIQVMTALVRRETLEHSGLPGAQFRRSDDWYLWLLLSFNKAEFCYIDTILSFQRRQEKGTLSDQKTYFIETAETNIAIYREFEKKLSINDQRLFDIPRLLNFWYFRAVLGYLILGSRQEALTALRMFHAMSISDSLKKRGVQLLLLFFPAGVLGRIIFTLREFARRRSFEVIKDSSITLPLV